MKFLFKTRNFRDTDTKIWMCSVQCINSKHSTYQLFRKQTKMRYDDQTQSIARVLPQSLTIDSKFRRLFYFLVKNVKNFKSVINHRSTPITHHPSVISHHPSSNGAFYSQRYQKRHVKNNNLTFFATMILT